MAAAMASVIVGACLLGVPGIPAAAAPGPGVGQVGYTNFILALSNGTVYTFGGARYFGSPGAQPLNQPIVGITETADFGGYWMVAADGGVFSYGSARFFGSTGGMALDGPIVGLTPTPDAKGYWLVGSDGGIFSFGDAPYFGSMGGHALNEPIVGLTPTPDAKGYWLFASDGGIFSYGDAAFYGSTGDLALNQPIVAMAATPDGKGYWLMGADGGVFAFGDAAYYGSTGSKPGEPAERIVPTRSGAGYWIVDQNGTSTAFGNALGTGEPVQALLFTPQSPGDKAVAWAFTQLGKPYIWGGNGPQGYDCSGLVLASWHTADGVTFARVADDQYHTAGTPVAMTTLVTGDLVFWGTDQQAWTTVYHVAMYVGGGRIIESSGGGVQLNSIGWATSDLMPDGRLP
jgi:cell wall-associated NlpC family hydrolase